MFCTKCGKQNGDGQKFCQYCGAPLNTWVPDRGRTAVRKRAPFRMRPLYWVLIAEAALAAAGIVFGVTYCRNRFSARYVAETYAEALEDRDWGRAYDCLDMEGETGLLKEDYVAAREALPAEEMDQTTVEEIAPEEDDYFGQMYSLNDESDGSRDSVDMEIRSRVNGDMQSTVVTVVRTGKKWFFFDEWKIVPYNMYGENVEVSIPENVSLTINGVELDTDSLESAGSSGEQSGIESYILPHVFYGGYQIRLTQEGMEPWTKLVEYDGSSGTFDFSDISLMPTADTVSDLLSLYGEAGQAYFSAALSGGSFSSLKQYFTEEALEASSLAEDFSYIQENVPGASKSQGYQKIEISGLQGESMPVSEFSEARPGDVVLNLRGNVMVTRQTSGGSAEELGGEREWPEPVCFRRENGVWKIQNPEFKRLIN